MTPEEYLKDHTINQKSIDKFHITTTEVSVDFPIPNGSGDFVTKKRMLSGDEKFKIPHGTKSDLFNKEIISEATAYIVITGGEMDAIRLDQEGINAVSSTTGETSFSPAAVKLVEKIPHIFLALDNDVPGKNATQLLLKKLPTAKVIKFPTAVKDVCEFFKFNDRKAFEGLMAEATVAKDIESNQSNESEKYTPFPASRILEMEFEDEQWLIDRFITIGGITLIVGESGSGKSYITLAMIKAIIKGEMFLDKFQAVKNVKILVIDKENGIRRTKTRMQSMGVPFSDDLFFLPAPELFTLDNKLALTTISDFIRANDINFVIVDSLIDVIIGSENSSVDVSQVFNSLRALAPNTAFVIIHHDAKPVPNFAKTAGQRTRGSSNIIAQVDNQFFLEKQKNNLLFIEQGKSRDFEPLPKFVVEFESNGEGQMIGFKNLGEATSETTKVDDAISFIEGYLIVNPEIPRQRIIDYGRGEGHTEASIRRGLEVMRDRKVLGVKQDPEHKQRQLLFIINQDETSTIVEEELDFVDSLDKE